MRIHRPGDPVEPLREAVARGVPLVIPTESTYALGVDPALAAGVERIFQLKARDRGKPLLVVAADRAQILSLGVAPEDPALSWALERWPAALTVVFGIREPLPASAGASTLAIRIPDSGELRCLLAALGRPLTATSANPSGEPAMADPAAVVSWLAGKECWLVDRGILPGGPPSTLVQRIEGKMEILRSGRDSI